MGYPKIRYIDCNLDSPETLVESMQKFFESTGKKPTCIVMDSQSYTNFIGDVARFHNLFDPCTKYGDLCNGYVGRLLGLNVMTNEFFDPDDDRIQLVQGCKLV